MALRHQPRPPFDPARLGWGGVKNQASLLGLQAMRARLSDPGAWTKGANARDAEGNVVPFKSPDAVCWSLQGARGMLPPDQFLATRDILRNGTGMRWVYFNDAAVTTHDDVLFVLDDLIAKEHAKPEFVPVRLRYAFAELVASSW